MPTVILIRDNFYPCLEGYDDASAETINTLPPNRPLLASIRQPRNLAHHRKFFALVNLIFDNQSQFASKDELIACLKVYVGHCQVYERKGELIKVPKSIAFDQMDQVDFDDFYRRVLDVVARDLWPSVTVDWLKAAIEEYL